MNNRNSKNSKPYTISFSSTGGDLPPIEGENRIRMTGTLEYAEILDDLNNNL